MRDPWTPRLKGGTATALILIILSLLQVLNPPASFGNHGTMYVGAPPRPSGAQSFDTAGIVVTENGSRSAGDTQRSPPPAGYIPATVLNTLILANRTVLPGNVPALDNGFVWALAINPQSGEIFAPSGNGGIEIINTSTPEIANIIPTDQGLGYVAYDPSNGEIYATPSNSSGDTVTVLNASTEKVVRTIQAGRNPEGVAVDPSNGEVYVMNTGSDNVTAINGSTDNVSGSIGVGSSPISMAVDSANGLLYVTNSGSNNVSIIDGATGKVVGSATVGIYPTGIVYDPSSQDLYVADSDPLGPGYPGSVSVINGSGGLVTSILVGGCPVGEAYDPQSGEIYVADSTCTTSGNVSVINTSTNQVVTTIGVGQYPTGIVYDAPNDRLYVADWLSEDIRIIDGTSGKVVGSIGDGEQPSAIAYDSMSNVAYVAESGGNQVAVLNASTGAELTTVEVGDAPAGLALDPRNGYLYVANSFSGNLTIVNTSTYQVVGWLTVGSIPQGIAFDTFNGDVYVANCGSDNVTIIDGATNSVVNSISAGICPYQFSVDPVNDRVFVTNRGPANAIEFVTENITVINGSTNKVIASIPAGGGPAGIAYDGKNNLIYVANWASDNLSVIDPASDLAIGSIPLGAPWTGNSPWALVYDSSDSEMFVTFGLGSTGDQMVAVNVSSGALLGSVVVGSFPLAITLSEQSGYILLTNWASGTVSTLSPNTLPRPQFSVSFVSSGLPISTQWSVTFDGVTNASTAVAIRFFAYDGPHNYSIASPRGFLLSQSEGTVAVNGSNVTLMVPFQELYSANFIESGLVGRFEWAVEWQDGPIYSTTSVVTLEVPNGSYSYEIPVQGAYFPTPPQGMAKVEGENFTLEVLFAPPPPPIIGSYRTTPSLVKTGSLVTFLVNVSGGALPLTYSYSGLPSGCPSANTSRLSCIPSTSGNFTVDLTVTDSIGRSAKGSILLTVSHPHSTLPGTNMSTAPSFLGFTLLQALVLVVVVGMGVAVAVLRFIRSREFRSASNPGDGQDQLPGTTEQGSGRKDRQD